MIRFGSIFGKKLLIQCDTVWCLVIQCAAIFSNAMKYIAVQNNTIWYNTIQCNAIFVPLGNFALKSKQSFFFNPSKMFYSCFSALHPNRSTFTGFKILPSMARLSFHPRITSPKTYCGVKRSYTPWGPTAVERSGEGSSSMWRLEKLQCEETNNDTNK